MRTAAELRALRAAMKEQMDKDAAARTVQRPSSRTGGPRGTARVRRETVSNFETGFHGLPLDETGFQGWL